jgi:hypothetical protein
MRASLRRVLRAKEAQGNEWVQEWDDVEIVERLESLEAEIESLRAERDELRAELAVANGGERESESETLGRARMTSRDLVVWWKLPLLTLLVLAPWAVIGSIVWLLAA